MVAVKQKPPVVKQEEPSDVVVQAYGVSLITSYLLEFVSRMFKSDNKFYKAKNKYYIDGIVKHNADILKEVEKLRQLKDPSLRNDPKIKQMEIDSDTLSFEMETQFNTIRDFVHIYLKSSYSKLCNFGLLLENIKADKPVYTQEEVEYILKKAITDFTKIEPTDLLIERYV